MSPDSVRHNFPSVCSFYAHRTTNNMENSLKRARKRERLLSLKTCNPLSQEEFLNYKRTLSQFMQTLQQKHAAVLFG